MNGHSPERVPGVRPACLPTVEMSWHGNPPHSTSTGSTLRQSMAEISPRFGAAGQWAANAPATGVLSSENQTVSASSCYSAARSRPPYPLNSEPIFNRRREGEEVCGMRAPAGHGKPDTRTPYRVPRRDEHLPGARPSQHDVASHGQPIPRCRRHQPSQAITTQTLRNLTFPTPSRAITPLADRGVHSCTLRYIGLMETISDGATDVRQDRSSTQAARTRHTSA